MLIGLLIHNGHTRFTTAKLASALDSRNRGVVAPLKVKWTTLWGPRSTVLLSLVAAASLIPNFPLPESTSYVPTYFTSKLVNRIPEGSTVLISPYPSPSEVLPELWQALANMRFKIVGGYGMFTSPLGSETGYPVLLQPDDVITYMWGQVADQVPTYPTNQYPAFKATSIPKLTPHLVQDTRIFLKQNHIGTVIVAQVGTYPDNVVSLMTQALGPPTVVTSDPNTQSSGPVSVWYKINRILESK